MWGVRTSYTIAAWFPKYGCMNDRTTEHSFDLQAPCVIDVFGIILSTIVCTTSHWHRRLVELNVILNFKGRMGMNDIELMNCFREIESTDV